MDKYHIQVNSFFPIFEFFESFNFSLLFFPHFLFQFFSNFSGMNNREVIDQVERGYRMAQPSTIIYPESKTLPSEVKIAQANVYKVFKKFTQKIEKSFQIVRFFSDNARVLEPRSAEKADLRISYSHV